MRPCRSRVLAISAINDALSVIFRGIASTRPGLDTAISSATLIAASALRSATTTILPCSAIALTNEGPSKPAPPVTTTTVLLSIAVLTEKLLKIGYGFFQSVFQGHYGFPTEFFTRQGYVGLALPRVVLWQRHKNQPGF